MEFLAQLFSRLLTLSLAGGLLIALLLACKAFGGKHFSPTWHCYSWVVVLVVLMVPFSLSLPQKSAIVGFDVMLEHPFLELPPILQTPALAPATDALWKSIPFYLLWLVGMVVFFLLKGIDYHRFKKALLQASCPCSPLAQQTADKARRRLGLPSSIKVLECPVIGSPLVMGLLRPLVFIPCHSTDAKKLDMMLTHEFTHLRSYDLWYKAIALCINGIHWFNPLCYLMVRDINNSCELCCDWRMTASYPAKTRRKYGELLLEMAEKNTWTQSTQNTSLSFSKGILKRRLLFMMNHQKFSIFSRLCALALVAALGATGVVCSAAMRPTESTRSKVTVSSNETYFATEPPAPTPETPSVAPTDDAIPTFAIPQKDGEVDSNATLLTLVQDERLSDLEMVWPTQGSLVATSFLQYSGHTGMDIVGKVGDPIYAAADGEVLFAEWGASYGYLLVINHGGGVVTRYAHASKLLVQEGDGVTAGQLVAQVGQTGRATGPHLHFEVMVGDSYNDPALYIGDKAPKA